MEREHLQIHFLHTYLLSSPQSDYEKSSVPLDVVLATGRILVDSCLKYGDFSKTSWLTLSDFLNTSRMGKDHYDRDSLVSEFYHALILLLEVKN